LKRLSRISYSALR